MMSEYDYSFQDGDFLLIKIVDKRVGRPAAPSGETYSDHGFRLFGGPNPVYQRYDIGEVAPVKLVSHNGLAAKSKNFPKSNEEIHKEYMTLQKKRRDSYSPKVKLNDASDTPDHTDTSVESQEDERNIETTSHDEWSESKSDRMSDLL